MLNIKINDGWTVFLNGDLNANREYPDYVQKKMIFSLRHLFVGARYLPAFSE